MYSQRQNIDLDAILDKAPTPNRLRPPSNDCTYLAPIRKVPMKMVPNKENIINQNNQWIPQSQPLNSRNFDDMGHKGIMGMDNAAKKPLISPVRNPFKTQIDNMNV